MYKIVRVLVLFTLQIIGFQDSFLQAPDILQKRVHAPTELVGAEDEGESSAFPDLPHV